MVGVLRRADLQEDLEDLEDLEDADLDLKIERLPRVIHLRLTIDILSYIIEKAPAQWGFSDFRRWLFCRPSARFLVREAISYSQLHNKKIPVNFSLDIARILLADLEERGLIFKSNLRSERYCTSVSGDKYYRDFQDYTGRVTFMLDLSHKLS